MNETMYSDLPECYWMLHADAERCNVAPHVRSQLTSLFPLEQIVR